ncbi:hypothetical protein DERP_010309 [Dermatophagoides pteronyssinus]|uniref:Uncharacterized protein n=1 Tax=Dermatophagoides pteronyssinus TaxID=6956 RepID=A0ABQ8IYS3_DERPT|nr:hypothetical protein DERP_010309 [Dermatophagoides pteronyssinus]
MHEHLKKYLKLKTIFHRYSMIDNNNMIYLRFVPRQMFFAGIKFWTFVISFYSSMGINNDSDKANYY